MTTKKNSLEKIDNLNEEILKSQDKLVELELKKLKPRVNLDKIDLKIRKTKKQIFKYKNKIKDLEKSINKKSCFGGKELLRQITRYSNILKCGDVKPDGSYTYPNNVKIKNVQLELDKLKKELGLPVPAAKTESPKRVSPKTKAKKTSKYENILDRYTPTDIEKATKAINKTIKNDQSSENLVEYLDALKEKYVKKFLENLVKDPVKTFKDFLNSLIEAFKGTLKKLDDSMKKSADAKPQEDEPKTEAVGGGTQITNDITNLIGEA
jgi:hypothetical protein